MKPKTLRYLASAAIVPLAFEFLPYAPEADEDCVADVKINLCSANLDARGLPSPGTSTHRIATTKLGQVGLLNGW